MFVVAAPARAVCTRAPIRIGLALGLSILLATFGCSGSNGNPLADGGRPTLGASATTDESSDDVIDPAGVDPSGSGGETELRFTAEPVFCCNPLSLDFSAELLGPVPSGSVTYEWEFGDGRTGRGAATTHTYSWADDYHVTLTAVVGTGEAITTSRVLTLGVGGDGVGSVTLAPDPEDDPIGGPDEDGDDGDINPADVDPDPDPDGGDPDGGDSDAPDGGLGGGQDDPITDDGDNVDDDPGGGGVEPTPLVHIIRAMYSSAETEHLEAGALVDGAVTDGFTDFVVKFGLLESPLGVYDVVGLNAWIQKLDESGGRFWPAINWVSTSELAWIAPFEAFVTADGVALPQTPCPTSEHFWTRSIAERGAALAAIALDHPTLEGMVVDVEMYHSELRKYTGPSYSDTAFQAYIDSVAPGTALPPASQRYAWVSSHGGEQPYIDFQQALVRGLAADALAAIRSVNPDFEVGGTGIIKGGEWFYDAFALGFGTEQQPVYGFSQRYYRAGYSNDVQDFVAGYQARGIHAKLVMGLQLDYYPPDALANHFYTGAIETAGAWIYDASEFADGAQDDNCHTIEEYRSALQLANSELDAVRADPGHTSPLAAGPFVPACSDEDPVMPSTVYVPLEDGPVTTEELRVRQRTTYYFYATAGEPISFDLVLQRVSSEYLTGWWILKGPDETTIDSGAWMPETSPALVRATAYETGLHALVIDPSWRFPVTITNASHPGSYTGALADGRLRLFRAHALGEPQLFAYVPPGVTDIGVTVLGHTGEQTHVAVVDQRDPGVVLFEATPQAVIDADFTLALPNDAGGDGVVLGVVLQDAGGAEDFEFKIRSGALPFLSQTRSGLLREP